MTKLSELKVGDRVRVNGFSCLPDGAVKTVCLHQSEGFFVECEKGKHWLDSQLDYADNETLIGVEKVENENG